MGGRTFGWSITFVGTVSGDRFPLFVAEEEEEEEEVVEEEEEEEEE